MNLSMQASLIPTVLGLSEFFRRSFPHVDWYPYWYLGNPFRYLIGPVVPVVLSLLGKSFPYVALYFLYVWVIIASILIASIGIYWLISTLATNSLKLRFHIGAFFGAVLYIAFPLNWVMLYSQNGLNLVAFAVMPYVFLLYYWWIDSVTKKRNSFWRIIVLSVLISFCLLISVDSLLSLLLGVTGILISRNSAKSFVMKQVVLISVLIFLLSLGLASFWYTVGFWWVMLSNPSFGGIPLWHVVLNLFSSGMQFLPIVFAVLLVKWRHIRMKYSLAFGMYFFFSFLILSLIRFLANPAFVLDWISFGTELQFGGAILGGIILEKAISCLQAKRFLFVVLFLFLGFSMVISGFLLKGVFLYTKTDYQSRIISLISLHNFDKMAHVFLSGSPVFWIDQYLPVQQVRGGNDMASVNPSWADGAYQVREGQSASLTQDWLQIWGGKYVLINQSNSQELFHDFVHQEKFRDFPVLKSLTGDTVIEIPNVSMVRVAGSDLLTIGKLNNGADAHTLSEYVDSFLRSADFTFEGPDKIRVGAVLKQHEVLSLAVTYDAGWHLLKGSGEIVSDSLGNLVVIPAHAGEQTFVLAYSVGLNSYMLVSLLIGICILGILFSESLSSLLDGLFARLQLGIDEGEEY